jgi:hypothetical protein
MVTATTRAGKARAADAHAARGLLADECDMAAR